MKRAMWIIVASMVSAYLGVAGVLYLFQRSLIYPPETTRPNATAIGIPTLQEVILVTEDHLRLLAWYLPPAAGQPTMIYFHGNGGNLANRAGRVERLAAAGIGAVMVEYRGYGGNPGQPTEFGFYADAAAAWRFAHELGIDPARIVVYGESLGTGVATWLATEHRVGALVLESPYTSLAAVAARHYGFLPISLLLKDRFDSLSRIARVQAPILVLQGERDQVIPPALGRELFKAAPEPKQLWTAPAGSHHDLIDHGAAEVLFAFLDRWLAARR